MEPVLVIHGIGNRDPKGFETQVKAFETTFESTTGNRNFQFIPVYWGDLGARTTHLDACMPDAAPAPSFNLPAIPLEKMDLGELMGLLRNVSPWLSGPIRLQIENAINRGAGDVARTYLAQVYQSIRQNNRVMITETLGDILVYQRNQVAIQKRVLEVLKAFDRDNAGYGTVKKPVHAIAHSLGGVVALDLITRPRMPLHVQSLTTFGSQFPYFQLVDPRPGVPPYGGAPVKLPLALKKWTNLWEPLDPLSFVASKVFRLADGRAVQDVEVHSQDGLQGLLNGLYYTHNIYWSTPELLNAVVQNLTGKTR